MTAELDTPALSLDISALDEDDDELVAAAMLCSWTWAAALIDGSRGARAAPQRAAHPGRAVEGAAGGARAGGTLRSGHPPGPAPRRGLHPGHPLPRRTSRRCPPRPTGPKPAAWPPATAWSCSAAWTITNSTGSAASPRCPAANAPWCAAGPPHRPGFPAASTRPRQIPDQVRGPHRAAGRIGPDRHRTSPLRHRPRWRPPGVTEQGVTAP